MPWGEIGAVLVVLVVVFIAGRVWFHLVEGILDRIKRIFVRKEPQAWHTLPPEKEIEEDDGHV